MKKLILAFLVPLFGAVFFSSCEKVVGTGPTVTELRNVTGFTGISISTSGRVNFYIGPVYKVEVQAQQNILDKLETYRDQDQLIVKTKPGVWIKPTETINVNITAPVLNYVNLDGSANVYIHGNAVAPVSAFRISGSGNIEADTLTVADQFTATLSGSGDVKVMKGNINKQLLKTSGSGKIDMGGVVSNKTEADINGSGSMWVHTLQELNVKIDGSGSVYYRGTPLVSTRISGSGRVRPY